jgi:hypothetical protein
MGEIVRFRLPQSVPATPVARHASAPFGYPAQDFDGYPDDIAADDPLLDEAYAATFAAAERYERERRRERDLQARIDALTRENARLRAELAKKPDPSQS